MLFRSNVNGKTWTFVDRASITLPYDQLPQTAAIEVALGHATFLGFKPPPPQLAPAQVPPNDRAWRQLQSNPTDPATASTPPEIVQLLADATRLHRFQELLRQDDLAPPYPAAHARLALNALNAAHHRFTLLTDDKLRPLANPVSRAAADRLYLDTARKLCDGLNQVLTTYDTATDPDKLRIARLWQRTANGM